MRGNVVYFDNGSGALQSAEASYTVVEKGGTESKTNNGIEFNASWDNPIYSDDNLKPTVDALFGLNLIKAFYRISLERLQTFTVEQTLET